MKLAKTPWVVGAMGVVLTAWPHAKLPAQTKERGPWWPHPLWGPGDQAGASNWMTPEKLLAALTLVKTGKVYELGHIYDRAMPLRAGRTYAIFTFQAGPAHNVMANDEFLAAAVGQVGTQLDGPGHIGMRLTMTDGSIKDVYYNGFNMQDDMGGGKGGLRALGIEHIKPYITRGIVIDIAGYKGQDTLPRGYEVTVADVRGALSRQGIAESGIKAGDALFFNYGWSKLWNDPVRYDDDDAPGIGVAVAEWVIDRKAALVGSDQHSTEMGTPRDSFHGAVHQELITKNGILNIENMVFDDLIKDGVYEFLFIFTPIPFKGATGSPGRPLAIR